VGFQAAVRAVLSGVQATGKVQDVRPPAVSKDRHDVLIQFAMKGDPIQPPTGCSQSWTW
jgi:hypothetical protein